MTPLNAAVFNPMRGGPSFSFGHRVRRFVWVATWLILASWTPPPLRAWRLLLLRVFGAKAAWRANVYATAQIWDPLNLEMDEYSCLGPGAICYCMAPIRLGRHALVSQGAHLCAGTYDIEDPNFQLVRSPIEIGPFAWVAAEAFVGPGVTIGEGAVLGARAVAFKDLPPWTIHVGNPAKYLRNRKSRPS